MDPSFITILQQLIVEQGKESLFNPGKCKALLADYTRGDFKKESRLFLQALDAGVVKAIDAAQELEICRKQQVRLLHEDYFLTEEIAIDVVDTLVLVLKGEEQKQDKNICKKCGKELQEEWKACPFCGTGLLQTLDTFSQLNMNGFDKAKWGNSIEEIKKLYPKYSEKQDQNNHNVKELYSGDINKNGYIESITFTFYNNKLGSVFVTYANSENIDHFESKIYGHLINTFVEKYGQPYSITKDDDEIITKNVNGYYDETFILGKDVSPEMVITIWDTISYEKSKDEIFFHMMAFKYSNPKITNEF